MASNSETVLRQLVERIEGLETQKAEISDEIKLAYTEAKVTGFNPKVLRKIVALRKMDPNERREERSLMEVYAAALGMPDDLV